jgi:hypothetical protein
MRRFLNQKLRAAFGLLALFGFLPAQDAEPPNPKPQYLILTTYHVKPSADSDFADLLKNKWMPAMKKAGASPRIFSCLQQAAGQVLTSSRAPWIR